jgi:hypothetical protein
MNATQLMFAQSATLVVLGFIAGAAFDDWQIVIDVQAVTVIGATLLHLLRNGEAADDPTDRYHPPRDVFARCWRCHCRNDKGQLGGHHRRPDAFCGHCRLGAAQLGGAPVMELLGDVVVVCGPAGPVFWAFRDPWLSGLWIVVGLTVRWYQRHWARPPYNGDSEHGDAD